MQTQVLDNAPSTRKRDEGGLFKMAQVGTILCARCSKKRESYVCPNCGSEKCMIKLYWKGEDHQLRHQGDDLPLGFFEAERFLTVLRAKIDDHKRKKLVFDPRIYLTSEVKSLRLVVIVDKWMEDLEKRMKDKELSPGSYDLYNTYRKTHWCAELTDKYGEPFSLRNMNVTKIGAKTLKKFKDLLPGNISLSYKRKIMSGLRTFFLWMHREEIIEIVPPFPIIRGDDTKTRTAITIESQDMYLAKIPVQHQDIFQFAFNTGLREGELAALKVKDVNTETWELTVQRTYSSGNVLSETTKGRHKDCIPLSDEAIQICRRHISNLPESFLFINYGTGRGYLPQTIYKIWVATGSPVSFHEAGRHSFATQLAKSGAKVEQIQRLCRHRDIRTSMQYIHCELTDLREVVNRRSEIVSLKSVWEAKKANETKV